MSSHSLTPFQALSGKKPWSEVKEDGRVVLGIALGRTPARPELRAIDDRHWAFIEQCWLSVQARPLAKELITSIEQFLSCYPSLKTTLDASSLGGFKGGTDDGLFEEEGKDVFGGNVI